MLRVTRRELGEEACCAYCRGTLDDGALLVDCGGCGVTEHAECSREAPRCPTIGCPGRSWRLRPPLHATGAPPPPPPLAPLTSRLCFTCGVIVDRSALQCGACRPAPPTRAEPAPMRTSTSEVASSEARTFVGRPLVGTQPWPDRRPTSAVAWTQAARHQWAQGVVDGLEILGVLLLVVGCGGAFVGAVELIASGWLDAKLASVVGDAGPFVVVIALGALLTIAGIVVSRRRGPG